MHQHRVKHNNYTYASVLSLCSFAVLDHGKQVQPLVIKTGFLARPSMINAQLAMYFNFGKVFDACTMFEKSELTGHDHITFNAMIAGLGDTGRDKVKTLCLLSAYPVMSAFQFATFFCDITLNT